MKSFIRNAITAMSVAAALTAATTAYSADDEVVKITPATKTVGVYLGDNVTFIDEKTGQSFTQTFNAAEAGVDLNQFAPDGALAGQHVSLYVWDESGGSSD
jgi:hypothetical protein